MTDIPVDQIRPGDRVYLSAGYCKGSIVMVVVRDGDTWRTTIGVGISSLDKPLRILQPGDVIPKGARYSWVQADGTLGPESERAADSTVRHCDLPRVILSMPEPKRTRAELERDVLDAAKAVSDADLSVYDDVPNADTLMNRLDRAVSALDRCEDD